MRYYQIFVTSILTLLVPIFIFASITPLKLKPENLITSTPDKTKEVVEGSPTPKRLSTSAPTATPIVTKATDSSLTSVPTPVQDGLPLLSPIVLFGIFITPTIIGLLGLAALFLQFRNLQGNTENLIRESQTEIAIIKEKLSHLEPVTQAVGDVRTEVRGLIEKTSVVERNQTVVHKSSEDLAALKVLADGLVQSTQLIQSQLEQAKSDLTKLQANAEARQDVEQQIAGSVRRLETVIAGTQSKGSAGESILEAAFAKLPVEWQVRNFSVNGKSVEFGLRLPNNLVLPIDSKWTATNLLEQFAASKTVVEQQKLRKEIEKAVLQKAKEVQKYVDPNVTVSFGLAVVPDAVYELCFGTQVEVFQLNVVLVSYSMFIPYLLLVFQTTFKMGRNLDLQKLESYLQTAQTSINTLKDELDGRFAKAVTMLNNSRDDMRVHISKVDSSLTGLQISTTIPAALPASTEALNISSDS
jgi:DNA recombination protein RmuC